MNIKREFLDLYIKNSVFCDFLFLSIILRPLRFIPWPLGRFPNLQAKKPTVVFCLW